MNTKQPKSWRDVIAIHPAAELSPMMAADDQKALGEDIKRKGLISPIAITTNRKVCGDWEYQLLDGRNRLDAMELAGIPFELVLKDGKCKIETALDYAKDGGWFPEATVINDDDPYSYVMSANEHRRHETPDDRRKTIAKLLKAQPGKSNRIIAKQAKVDDKTVAAVRGKLEATAEIPQLTKTVGADGKARTMAPKKRRDIADDEPAQAEGAFPVHFGSCHGGRVVTERTSTKPKANAAGAPALAPQQIDPDHLIAQFATVIRSGGLNIARQIEANHRPRLIERLREVIDEIEIEADRWAKEPDRPDEGIPEFLRRT